MLRHGLPVGNRKLRVCVSLVDYEGEILAHFEEPFCSTST